MERFKLFKKFENQIRTFLQFFTVKKQNQNKTEVTYYRIETFPYI